MSRIGMIRYVDNAGRIVLPRELRMTMDINIGDFLKISIKEKSIILEKVQYSKTLNKKHV